MSSAKEISTDMVDNNNPTNPEQTEEEPFIYVQRKKNNKKNVATPSNTAVSLQKSLASKDKDNSTLDDSALLPGWSSSRKPRRIKNNSQRARMLVAQDQQEKSIDWGIDMINDRILTLKQSKFYNAFQDLVQLTIYPPCQSREPLQAKPILDSSPIVKSSVLSPLEPTTRDESSNCNGTMPKEPSDMKANGVIDMVFYGIGCIESSRNSQFQLALGLCLKEILKITGTVSISDPVMTEYDKKLIEKLGLLVLKANDKADEIKGNRTLFYMPHCPKGLYSRVLESNWSRKQLDNLVILGNRFTMYDERQLAKQAPFILPALSISNVSVFPQVKFEDNTIFNDLAFHYFPSGKSVPEVDTTDREEDPECL
ncbi:sensitivity to red-light reduced protein [Entomortierella beljakovae]|nr:sensitivity to red-light reduced protein [Entomortierella beljakovae]